MEYVETSTSRHVQSLFRSCPLASPPLFTVFAAVPLLRVPLYLSPCHLHLACRGDLFRGAHKQQAAKNTSVIRGNSARGFIITADSNSIGVAHGACVNTYIRLRCKHRYAPWNETPPCPLITPSSVFIRTPFVRFSLNTIISVRKRNILQIQFVQNYSIDSLVLTSFYRTSLAMSFPN